MAKIIDVSWPLEPGIAVYPGNPELRITPQMGKTSVHSQIAIGSHTGTHIDAPRHVFARGKGIDAVSLDMLVGPCRVLDCTQAKVAVTVADLSSQRIARGERILVKTKNSRLGHQVFYTAYVYLDGDAAEWLAARRIKLFGIDYLSVKQRGSTDNRPHTALLGRGIPIVEGLDLKNVKPGRYQLVALPLKFVGLDGAPARVVLIS